MALWHARNSDPFGNDVTVAFHISIPVGNNRAGVAYRTALVKSGLGGRTVMTVGTLAGEILATEKAQIDAGEVYEHVMDVGSNPGETAAALQSRIDALHASLTISVRAELQRALTYWGFDRV